MKLFDRVLNPREIRRRLGLNQEQFWTQIGVTQSGGSRYESGREMPKPVRELLRLVHVEQIDLSQVKRVDFEIISYLKESHPDLYRSLRRAVRSKHARGAEQGVGGMATAAIDGDGRRHRDAGHAASGGRPRDLTRPRDPGQTAPARPALFICGAGSALDRLRPRSADRTIVPETRDDAPQQVLAPAESPGVKWHVSGIGCRSAARRLNADRARGTHHGPTTAARRMRRHNQGARG